MAIADITQRMPPAKPQRFLEAAPVGADLSKVGDKFLHWLLIDPQDGVIKYAKTDRTKKAIQDVADLYVKKIAGEVVEADEWKKARTAADAADAAYAAYAAYAADAASAYAADAASAYAADAASAYAADAASAYAADAAYAAERLRRRRRRRRLRLRRRRRRLRHYPRLTHHRAEPTPLPVSHVAKEYNRAHSCKHFWSARDKNGTRECLWCGIKITKL